MDIKREPWFCGCMSWMLPGAGQFYSRRIWKGLIFLLLWIGAGVAKDYMLGTTRFLGLLPAIGFFIFGILVPVLATWDAVSYARRQKALENITPDPWFPVFLSMILGLFSYVYMRKWFFVFLWLFLAALSVLSMFIIHSKLLVMIIIVVFYFGVIAHVYFISNKKYGQMGGKATILFFVLFVFGAFLDIANSYIEGRHGLWYASCGSESMEPTLKVGERIIVNNFAYVMSDPEVNDIVVIKRSRVIRYPYASESAEAVQSPFFIKRIVARWGDIIEVNDGIVKVNGKIRPYYPDISNYSGTRTTPHKGLLTYCVPEGNFFVMGDNIDNSFDSRYFGPVPRDAIIGKVVKVYWPLSRARILK